MFPFITTNFAAACESSFFGMKAWYHYLQTEQVAGGGCEITKFDFIPTSGTSDVALVALAVIDDLLRLAAFVVVGVIIYGAVLYIKSQGQPDQTQKAQAAIQNAIIGLIICLVAIGIVSYLGARLGG